MALPRGGLKEFAETRKPAVHGERFGEATLLTFPEPAAEVDSLKRSGDPDDGELKALVARHGLAGLTSELIWHPLTIRESLHSEPAARFQQPANALLKAKHPGGRCSTSSIGSSGSCPSR